MIEFIFKILLTFLALLSYLQIEELRKISKQQIIVETADYQELKTRTDILARALKEVSYEADVLTNAYLDKK